ncbi:hypothetical protein C0Z16_32885 [Paraburkholderia rhynchosiae]|uniref:Uncharacterized protein n=1 Tax=Paraburkholderia rhynchosiae TaxID=487049 RepID=A0ABX4UYD9_9BURK|nr:hypothetical protein C0Z16_32885 [Paraburkholderia rhynchosiae]
MGNKAGSPSALPPDAEANLGRDGVEGGFEGVDRDDVTMPRAAPGAAWSGRRECLLLALVAEEPTVRMKILVICAHTLPRNVGGARIGWVRGRISMMIIGAPQCLQTKVGALVSDVSEILCAEAG